MLELEDIHIEDRMCEEFHGTFRQGIELNNLRMSEQIPSIQEQIDKEYQPFLQKRCRKTVRRN